MRFNVSRTGKICITFVIQRKTMSIFFFFLFRSPFGNCFGVTRKKRIDSFFFFKRSSFSKSFDQKWNEAGAMIERLFDENNWSKATYCYLLATSLFEANNSVANERVITLYKCEEQNESLVRHDRKTFPRLDVSPV